MDKALIENNGVVCDKQMELLVYDDVSFSKNLALASPFGLTNPTLRKLTCLHALQYAVLEQFMLRNPEYNNNNIHTITEDFIERSNTTFDIPSEQLMACLGYVDKTKYYSLGQVLDLFEEISNETIGFDSYGVTRSRSDSKEWVGFYKIIASVERKNGYFRFNIPPKMVHRIVNPEISFRANIDWSGYSNKYSPSIYEVCMFYAESSLTYTDWFEVDLLRSMSGFSYNRYATFKDRVLNNALRNINSAPELDLYLELEEDCRDEDVKKRRGRNPVTHVRFKVTKKVLVSNSKSGVKSDITLSSQKTELRSLGIASNQVDDVLDETRGDNGELMLPYLSWCIRRGHEIKRFSEHAIKDHNMFGGFFRKKVIRDCKKEWLSIQGLLKDYVVQNHDKMTDYAIDKRVDELREKVKVFISEKYIRGLSDHGFAFFKESFVKFLSENIPAAHKQFEEGVFGTAVTEMDAQGTFYLNLYLDHQLTLFSFEAYKEYLSNPDNIFNV